MTNDLRIGLGIDVHRLEPGRPCILGGVEIPSPLGPTGHSDADLVLHAACDAVLGAAGLDDLGTLYSDQDPKNAGRSSVEMSAEVIRLVRDRGFEVCSLDLVVETERPILKPHRGTMRRKIAAVFGCPEDAVNVKGKSGEGLDHPIGRREAIRATAVALLRRA
ncbi:MAG: 2-C-methyl-D-erythritol 2,4-cyclodiphosphate synthase [Planctomycetota bacterium]